MKTLVTGAAGYLGSLVCSTLSDAGHEVVGVDQSYRADLAASLHVVDLLDNKAVYRLAEGCQAIVHLANMTGMHQRPLAHQVLTENLAMNANVFRPGFELGIKRFIFASSVQVMFGAEYGSDPLPAAYLPLDGDLPRHPRTNTYALSKEFGERLLEVMAQHADDITCTALRFPSLIGTSRRSRPRRFRLRDAYIEYYLTHLTVSDAARLILAALERERPGYHCYFPAQTYRVGDWSTARTIAELYPGVPLRLPAESIESLVDISRITENLGWKPLDESPVLEAESLR